VRGRGKGGQFTASETPTTALAWAAIPLTAQLPLSLVLLALTFVQTGFAVPPSEAMDPDFARTQMSQSAVLGGAVLAAGAANYALTVWQLVIAHRYSIGRAILTFLALVVLFYLAIIALLVMAR
jgi:uncharacterized membrane protein YidH (DUF202 family)